MATNIHKLFREEALSAQHALHVGIVSLHQDPIRRLKAYKDTIASNVAYEMDEHEIENPLSKEQTRILFKILNRDLPDCGRKRGAILRYIKAYMPELKRDFSLSVYNHLRNL